MKQGQRVLLLAVLIASGLLVAGTALAQESVTYTWTAPTTGSTVHHYVVQHSADGAAWTTVSDNLQATTYILTAAYDVEHSIRVAGVDALGRQGPWSVSSEPYTPTLGAPGQPGQPIAVF